MTASMDCAEFAGRGAIVTGGAQGIGRVIAQRLVEVGATVIVVDIDEEAGQQAQAALAACGKAHFLHCDIGQSDRIEAVVSEALVRAGRIDFLINNGGIGHDNPIEQLDLQTWNRIISVNLTAPYLMTRFSAAQLRQNHGAIVNIASIRGLMSRPDNEAYTASKGGIIALTHGLANSLGPDVRVNCISPGLIDIRPWQKKPLASTVPIPQATHDRHPVGRAGVPEDIAAVTLFLLSSQAAFITGQNISVDGGVSKCLQLDGPIA